MAQVVRIDTSEYVGYFTDLSGPLEPGVQGCIFDAWRYPDGRLRHEPPPRRRAPPARFNLHLLSGSRSR